MKIVAISDTHTFGPQIAVPDGDVLIHAGDHTFRGTAKEILDAMLWLASLPHKHKLLIGGNHDFFLDERIIEGHFFRAWTIERHGVSVAHFMSTFPSLTYLQDSEVIIDGVKFYGSPWVPEYGGWAFNLPRLPNGEHDRDAAATLWAKIPDDTNVLLTHTPPFGMLDLEPGYGTLEHLGCPALRHRIDKLTALRLSVFGHLHYSYGRLDYDSDDGRKLTFVNAAINTREYEPLNPPVVIEIA